VGQWSLKMNDFNDELHTIKLSDDGTYTAFSKEYDEHYHSTKDGALKESLKKHVIPAFTFVGKEELNILDICYGLGFNTLATLFYYKKYKPNVRLNIYSVELDASLVKSLVNFKYPLEFNEFKEVINSLSHDGMYKNKNIYIEICLGDAREYIKRFTDKFDIVYQDAFSPSVNPALWTIEYFYDIKNTMKKDGILTTYSTALKTRLALHENGFNIYVNNGVDFRNATVAAFKNLEGLKKVDMNHKISCNPDIKPLRD